jgi:insulysin
MQYQYFDIFTPDRDNRKIKGIKLKNGIIIVFVSDINITNSSCCVGVGAGSNNDTVNGIAHFLEHLLFMGNEKYPENNQYHEYIISNGGTDNAFTSDKITCYYFSLMHESFYKGLEILSWFFRKPLLDIKYIESESKIINSEHNKNINSDKWITDHLFKKFIKTEKFNKFSTGNNKSLEIITKETIFEFYNNYYTTDNMYVCIIDILPIDEMINKYIQLFEDIPKTTKNMPKLENIKLIDNNLIIYTSSLKSKYLNIFLLLDCDDKNKDDIQIINIINYLIGLEYYNSLCYKLKESNLTNEVLSAIDHYYDKQTLISVNIALKKEKNIETVIQYFHNYINNMYNLSYEHFSNIYNNIKNINTLKMLYKDKDNSQNVAISIAENLSKNFNNTCAYNDKIMNDCSKDIYNKFIKMIKHNKIKFITNYNILNIPDDKFIKDEYYNTSFYIGNYDINIKLDMTFDFHKSIILDSIDGIINNPVNIDLNKIPTLIKKNEKQLIYQLDINKYNKPQSNIVIIRKNNNLLDKYNKTYFDIYCLIIQNILNYYLDPLIDFEMNFKISSENNNYFLNFIGFNVFIYDYMKKILDLIQFDELFKLENIESTFNRVVSELKDIYVELKLDVPYVMCTNYIDIIIRDELHTDEIIKLLDKLTFDKFKNIYTDLFSYYKEIILIIGSVDLYTILQTIPKSNLLSHKTTVKNSLITDFNYSIPDKHTNEKNNCVIGCFIIKKYNYADENEKQKLYNKIIKYTFVANIMSKLISEPLFNKLRTIEKLGYIVRCKQINYVTPFETIITIQYMVQSDHNIKKLFKSFDNFNDNLKKTYFNEKNKKKFISLQKSMIKGMKLNHGFLKQETAYYRDLILNDIYDFNNKKIMYKIIKSITFDDIIKGFKLLLDAKMNTIEI